jgi:hypothetical protein
MKSSSTTIDNTSFSQRFAVGPIKLVVAVVSRFVSTCPAFEDAWCARTA